MAAHAGHVVQLREVAAPSEAQAKRRLADEYDAAQARGEVASPGKPVNLPDGNNKVSVAELGLTAKAIHEARQLRDAEAPASEMPGGIPQPVGDPEPRMPPVPLPWRGAGNVVSAAGCAVLSLIGAA